MNSPSLDPDEFHRLLTEATQQWQPVAPPLANLRTHVAHRRRVRIALAAVAAVVLVGAVATAARVISTRAGLPPATVTSPVPTPRSVVPTGSTPAPIPAGGLSGKLIGPMLAFSSPTNGLVTVGVLPDNNGPATYWTERTSDGGRHWTASATSTAADQPAAQFGVTFASSTAGWTYGLQLYSTDDGGRSWQQDQVSFNLPSDVAVSGASTWLVGYPCLTEQCQPVIYQTDRLGGPFTPLSTQPTTTDSITRILRPNPTTAWALVTPRRGQPTLAATDDDGQSWMTRPLPCPSTTFATGIAATGNDAMWLTCQQPSQNMCVDCAAALIYRSNDGGQNWTRVTPTPAPNATSLVGGGSITPVSNDVAWSVTGLAYVGSVTRTADGGRSWHTVLGGGQNGPDIVQLAAEGPNTAWALARAQTSQGNNILTIYRTADAGRTWQKIDLPPPA